MKFSHRYNKFYCIYRHSDKSLHLFSDVTLPARSGNRKSNVIPTIEIVVPSPELTSQRSASGVLLHPPTPTHPPSSGGSCSSSEFYDAPQNHRKPEEDSLRSVGCHGDGDDDVDDDSFAARWPPNAGSLGNGRRLNTVVVATDTSSL